MLNSALWAVPVAGLLTTQHGPVYKPVQLFHLIMLTWHQERVSMFVEYSSICTPMMAIERVSLNAHQLSLLITTPADA